LGGLLKKLLKSTSMLFITADSLNLDELQSTVPSYLTV